GAGGDGGRWARRGSQRRRGGAAGMLEISGGPTGRPAAAGTSPRLDYGPASFEEAHRLRGQPHGLLDHLDGTAERLGWTLETFLRRGAGRRLGGATPGGLAP